ncbi:MAG: hypothetical protein SGCHY_004126 [Lobulomycetales sp.]
MHMRQRLVLSLVSSLWLHVAREVFGETLFVDDVDLSITLSRMQLQARRNLFKRVRHIHLDISAGYDIRYRDLSVLASSFCGKLSHLSVCFEENTVRTYEILEIFLEACPFLAFVDLTGADFGDDPDVIGTRFQRHAPRLKQMQLIQCRGDIETLLNPIIPRGVLVFQ